MRPCIAANLQENLTQLPCTNPTMEKDFVQRKQRGKELSAAPGSFICIKGGGKRPKAVGLDALLPARCHNTAPCHCRAFAFRGSQQRPLEKAAVSKPSHVLILHEPEKAEHSTVNKEGFATHFSLLAAQVLVREVPLSSPRLFSLGFEGNVL